MREDPFRDQDRVEMEAAQRCACVCSVLMCVGCVVVRLTMLWLRGVFVCCAAEASRKIEVPVLAAPKPVASAAVPGATGA